MTKHALIWFRRDLRLDDNPALAAAARAGAVTAVYILDEDGAEGIRPMGAAQRVWLHHALDDLRQQLRSRLGITLLLRRGAAATVLADLVHQGKIDAVFWNRLYDPPSRARDAAIRKMLAERGVTGESFNAALLWEPPETVKADGTPFRVFTPFWKNRRAQGHPAAPMPAPSGQCGALSSVTLKSDRLDDWALLPHAPDWSEGIRAAWDMTAAGVARQMTAFVQERMDRYAADRDRPDRAATSGLSPYLAMGQLSPRQVWHAVIHAVSASSSHSTAAAEKFFSELGWREFCYTLLFYEQDIARHNIQKKFDRFPWRDDPAALLRWQRGMTGYPIIDAGLRQLWHTGWMHNRVRMLAASFLVKNLLLDWRHGEQWFWDTLVDADPANNPAGWQWVAGCGTDAAPYFRIFNPLTQAAKVDPDGAYGARWIPELGSAAYPAPMVDLGYTRARALDALAAMKKATA